MTLSMAVRHATLPPVAQALLAEYVDALDDLLTPEEHDRAIVYLAHRHDLTPTVVAGYLKMWREDHAVCLPYEGRVTPRTTKTQENAADE